MAIWSNASRLFSRDAAFAARVPPRGYLVITIHPLAGSDLMSYQPGSTGPIVSMMHADMASGMSEVVNRLTALHHASRSPAPTAADQPAPPPLPADVPPDLSTLTAPVPPSAGLGGMSVSPSPLRFLRAVMDLRGVQHPPLAMEDARKELV